MAELEPIANLQRELNTLRAQRNEVMARYYVEERLPHSLRWLAGHRRLLRVVYRLHPAWCPVLIVRDGYVL